MLCNLLRNITTPLTFEKIYQCSRLGGVKKFSKVSSVAIVCGNLGKELTFENIYQRSRFGGVHRKLPQRACEHGRNNFWEKFKRQLPHKFSI